VFDCGALDSIVTCLEDFDPGVKEGAAWALGYIAAHNAELAQHVVDAGTVPLLVLCIQEPELSLKRIAASALSDIAKHSPELAQAVVDAGAVAYLAPLVTNQDPKLKRQVRLLPLLALPLSQCIAMYSTACLKQPPLHPAP
jgi:HEAT repeat protein